MMLITISNAEDPLGEFVWFALFPVSMVWTDLLLLLLLYMWRCVIGVLVTGE